MRLSPPVAVVGVGMSAVLLVGCQSAPWEVASPGPSVAASTVLGRGATASHAASRKVVGRAATAGRRLPPLPTGRMSSSGVISYRVKGPLSGITGAVFVQLPGGYTNPVNAAVRYPVIETFW